MSDTEAMAARVRVLGAALEELIRAGEPLIADGGTGRQYNRWLAAMNDGREAIRTVNQPDDEDGREPWERCGCPACQSTMDLLHDAEDAL